MRVWPSKGEQRLKRPKKPSFASKEVLCKTPPKFSDFSCELGKCTENPKPKVQAKSLHLLLQNSGQLQKTLFLCKDLLLLNAAGVKQRAPSRPSAAAWQMLCKGHCHPLGDHHCWACCLLQGGNALRSSQVVSGQGQTLPYLPCTWQSESSLSSRGGDACDGPSTTVDTRSPQFIHVNAFSSSHISFAGQGIQQKAQHNVSEIHVGLFVNSAGSEGNCTVMPQFVLLLKSPSRAAMKNVFSQPLCFSKLYLLYLLQYERVNIYPFYSSLLPNMSAKYQMLILPSFR